MTTHARLRNIGASVGSYTDTSYYFCLFYCGKNTQQNFPSSPPLSEEFSSVTYIHTAMKNLQHFFFYFERLKLCLLNNNSPFSTLVTIFLFYFTFCTSYKMLGVLFSHCCYNKLSQIWRLKNIYSSGDQRSKVGPQGCIFSGGYRGRICLPSPDSRGSLHSLAHGYFLYLQS